MSNVPWKDAIERVLAEEETAMHYAEIATQVEERQLRTSLGATPANTVCKILNTSIQSDPNSPFYKSGIGTYGLKTQQNPVASSQGKSGSSQSILRPVDDSDPSIINAIGMYWLRSNVRWKNSPSLFGRQQVNSDVVDFSGQRGVYLLHDRRDVVYVGRSIDRPLGKRLFEHTIDRLNGRWDRFSWFGLYGVSESGDLDMTVADLNNESIISALESVLIESLEPPLNRRRGDNLNAVEFMQSPDPEIERRQFEEFMKQAMQQWDHK